VHIVPGHRRRTERLLWLGPGLEDRICSNGEGTHPLDAHRGGMESEALRWELVQSPEVFDHRDSRGKQSGVRGSREIMRVVDVQGADAHKGGTLVGQPRRRLAREGDWNGKQALVAAGVGITLFPPLALPAARRDVVLKAPTPRLPARRIYVACAPAGYRAPAVTAMIEELRAAARKRRRRIPQPPGRGRDAGVGERVRTEGSGAASWIWSRLERRSQSDRVQRLVREQPRPLHDAT